MTENLKKKVETASVLVTLNGYLMQCDEMIKSNNESIDNEKKKLSENGASAREVADNYNVKYYERMYERQCEIYDDIESIMEDEIVSDFERILHMMDFIESYKSWETREETYTLVKEYVVKHIGII